MMTSALANFLHRSNDNTASSSLIDLINTEDWRLAQMECDMNPREVGIWTFRAGFFDGCHDSRVLPLHQACALRPPSEFVEKLIECYPQGVKSCEPSFRRLPLHICCQTGASVEVVQLLIDNYPEAARARDSLGRLPIHYACSHGAPIEVVAALLDSFPGSASCADKNGWLPLHVACRIGESPEVVRALLDASPSSVIAKTKKGSTPLTCARKHVAAAVGKEDEEKSRAVVDMLEKVIAEKGLGAAAELGAEAGNESRDGSKAYAMGA